ncbi:unnamed protein product [Adineta ricciae]|uniref:Nucleolar protein 10 n=1 Tax=Adineta ricciae TaxID=249248 RepID=A0A813WXZ1_ADIRI|nr:unnamed protein product [Adineta ricciae]
MFLMYYLNEKGERVYTFKKVDPAGNPTQSAHPAKFSPDDQYSRQRLKLKTRHRLLLTQGPLPNKTSIATDVCSPGGCVCGISHRVINCDSKGWENLSSLEFPSQVNTLTLVANKLQFDRVEDIEKINNLTNLMDFSLNQNPLGKIPSFHINNLQSLSLIDTSLTSAEFPPSYNNCPLKAITLNDNKLRSINENDFAVLENSKLHRLHLDTASISKIDQNAFSVLKHLDSLSLKQNQLKSAEFLANLPRLSSIKLDGNQFTSLPPQLSIQKTMRIASLTSNSITNIDESSPLHTWLMKNWTSNRIYLANNPIDCCSSLWFIRFLQKTPEFVADRSLLKCAAPTSLAGQFLLDLNPDRLNCGDEPPKHSWWTIGRILGILGGIIGIVISFIIICIAYRYIRYRPSQSGYTEIDDPYVNVENTLPGGPVFPNLHDDEVDDRLSTYTYPDGTRSYAQTHSTADGVYAVDPSQTGDSVVERTALLSRPH